MKNTIHLKMTLEESQTLCFLNGIAIGHLTKDGMPVPASAKMLIDKIMVQLNAENYTYFYPKEEVTKALEENL